MLCGDEVRAIVSDLGSTYFKFGEAGQDLPRHIFRSCVGSIDRERTIVGDNRLRCIDYEIDISYPFIDGEINWSQLESLIDYGIHDCMRIDPTEYPILYTEDHFESTQSKCKLIEMTFESSHNPAVYIASNSMLNAFSLGKSTGLIIDFGATSTKVTPLVEGYSLKKSELKTLRGGNWLDSLFYAEIEREGFQITPWYLNPRYLAAHPKHPNTSHSPHLTHSFQEMHKFDLIRDVKHWMAIVPPSALPIPSPRSPATPASSSPSPSSQSTASSSSNSMSSSSSLSPSVSSSSSSLSQPGVSVPEYELPDGTLLESSQALCHLPEQWFSPCDPSRLFSSPEYSPSYVRSPLSSSSIPSTPRTPTSTPSTPKATTSRKSQKKEPTQTPSSASFSSDSSFSSSDSSFNTPCDPNAMSLQQLCYTSLTRTDIDVRRELLSNLILCGGGSVIDGLGNRLASELSTLLPTSYQKVKIVQSMPLERRNAAWIGGSILATCGSFQQLWMTKKEYEEYGSALVFDRFNH